MQITQLRPRSLEGDHTATITLVEETPKKKARISFKLKTVPPVTVRRDYPLSLNPRSALSTLLNDLQVEYQEDERGPFFDLAHLVGIKAQVRIVRRITATKNTVVSATRLRKGSQCA